MADQAPAYRIEVLAAPRELQRRPQAPRFIPPPARNNVAHAAMLSAGIDALRQSVQALTPEQRRAVYLKLTTETPISEGDLQRLSLIPVRQEGKSTTVALQIDNDLTQLRERVAAYAQGGAARPPHATVISNLAAPPISLPLADRMSEQFAAARNRLQQLPIAHIQVELGPLAVGSGLPAQLRAGAEQAFEKLRVAAQRAGAIHDHLWSADRISVTVNISVPGSLIATFCSSADWSFITWFDVVPQFQTIFERLNNFDVAQANIRPPTAGAPLICIIDTGVLEANALLTPAFRPGHSRSFNSTCVNNPSDESNHGTGVAGIAVYRDIGGRLQDVDFTPAAWLANARILDRNQELGPGQLFGKVLQDAIRHFHGMGCRIFNLSLNVRDRPYSARVPLDVAEALDTLVRELDIVVIVSAGNLDQQSIQDMLRAGQQYPNYCLDSTSRILDPAQAVNVVTVGSIAGSHTCTNVNHRPIAITKQPSPFTRCGPGINGYLKPELVDDGGNLVTDTGFNRIVQDAGSQIVTTRNEIGRLLHRTIGTSLAAPRVAHLSASILDALGSLRSRDGRGIAPSANLLRALLVNSAIVDDGAISLFAAGRGRAKKRWVELCGYGEPNLDRAITVSADRAIMIYQGEVDIDNVVYFAIPVPKELRQAGRSLRLLRITVAYDPPVRRTRTFQYAGIRMAWKLFRGDTSQDTIVDAMSVEETATEEDQTDGPEDGVATEDEDAPDEMSGAVFGSQIRTKSTVQHDVFQWKQHREAWSANPYTLAIVARRNWDTATQRQRFAVAVALECADHRVNVANAVAQHFRVAVPVEVRQQRG